MLVLVLPLLFDLLLQLQRLLFAGTPRLRLRRRTCHRLGAIHVVGCAGSLGRWIPSWGGLNLAIIIIAAHCLHDVHERGGKRVVLPHVLL